MALVEVFIVVYGLARADKSLIEGCKYCRGFSMTVSTPTCVVVA